MYERSYGYLYDANRPVKDDAASIRRTIRTMVKAGVLPGGWKFYVRYDSFAGGCAIRMTAVSPRPIYAADPSIYEDWVRNAETGEWVHGWKDKLTAEARTVLDACEELHAAHNHDGSEIQVDYFDVKFYGQVSLGTVDDVAEYEPERKGQSA